MTYWSLKIESISFNYVHVSRQRQKIHRNVPSGSRRGKKRQRDSGEIRTCGVTKIKRGYLWLYLLISLEFKDDEDIGFGIRELWGAVAALS